MPEAIIRNMGGIKGKKRNAGFGNANLPIGVARKGVTQGSGDRANQEIGVPGWHSRGYLPHLEFPLAIQHVTIHLADSLPKEVLERFEEELKAIPEDKQDVERRKRCEEWIDAGHGSCVLREPVVASMVQGALLFFDCQRYRLIDWVVMPNHLHVLFEPINGHTVAKIVASWKKFTATRICAFRRNGNANLPIGDSPEPVWHREYWDRFIRSEHHLQKVIEYIRLNPVKAGLVAAAEDWPWGSARWKKDNKSADPEIVVPKDANPEIGVPKDADPEIGVPREGR